LLPTLLYSQELSNIRKKVLSSPTVVLKLDTLSIIPSSLNLYNNNKELIDTSYYFFDNIKSTIFFKDTIFEKIYAEYKIFPYSFDNQKANKDTSLIVLKLEDYQNSFKYLPSENIEDFIPSQEISKQGNITRGVSFGNNQDLSLNSNLNLQLAGKINEDVSVIASISDDNIPIQAEGNTQQVQDFDKIFISVFDHKNKLTVGDYQIFKPEGYFVNYTKKLKGINYELDSTKIIDKIKLSKNQAGVAIAKGKYNRMNFNGIEANQGPYKLQGTNSEAFIIILSNSEKVYIDGVLLTRGENYDYTINYNSAEIIFTHKHLITKDKRITVEFEYSEKNYTRFLFYNSSQFETQNGNYFFNFYSESDAKNQTIQQELTNEQKLLLYNIGDSLHQATFVNADSIAYDPEKILYKKTDTLLYNSIYENIFIVSQNKNEAFYQVSFSYVGANGGNYKILNSNVNGRVYEWIAPVNNIQQGDYEPISYIVTPRAKQVLSFGGDINLNKSTTYDFEISLSNNDINTFSKKDAGDNFDFATKNKLHHYFIGNDSSETKLSSSVSHILIKENFDAIDFYKDTEFERDWNIQNSNKTDENIINFNTNLQHSNLLNLDYNLDAMNLKKDYNGIKNSLITNLNYFNFTINSNINFLQSKDNFKKTSFFRNNLMLKKHTKYIEIGGNYQTENNRWNNLLTDSLQNNSYAFNEFSLFIQTPDSFENQFTMVYKKRFDYFLSDNNLKINTFSNDYNFISKFKTNKSGYISNFVTFRELKIIDTLLTEQDSENSLVGNISYRQSFFKNSINLMSAYELGSGLERRNEYSYIEVMAGEGIYKWIDYNSNNIKELNEFEVANFSDEANYLRVFKQSNSYTKVYNNKINQVININTKRLWNDKKGVKKIVSLFANNFSYQLEQSSKYPFFPVNKDIITKDTNLTSLNYFLQNNFNLNKGGKISFNYIYSLQKNNTLLITGLDKKENMFNSFSLNLRLFSKFIFTNTLKIGNSSADYEFFNSKNYKIEYNQYISNFKYSFSKNRIDVFYNYREKKNVLGYEKYYENKLGLKIESSIQKKGKISFVGNYINIDYNSSDNQAVAYIMLEGLQSGNNFVWNVTYQHNISNSLNISFMYDGRFSEGGKIIHTGNMQVSAGF